MCDFRSEEISKYFFIFILKITGQILLLAGQQWPVADPWPRAGVGNYFLQGATSETRAVLGGRIKNKLNLILLNIPILKMCFTVC